MYVVKPRQVRPGLVVSIIHLTFGRARITRGPNNVVIDDGY